MISTSRTTSPPRQAFSLLELVAVVTLLGIVSAVTMLRYGSTDKSQIKINACGVKKGEVQLQVQLWQRSKGSAPQSNLGDIGADSRFFPKGLPTCPVDGTSYTIDPTTHQVIGHNH